MVLQKTIKVSALALMALGGAACGGGSSSSSGTVTPPAPVADTTSPAVSFSVSSLSVASGGTAASTLTATDNVGVTTGPSTSCTNGGSFAGSTFTAPTVTVDTTVVCTATASDAAGNSGTANLTVTVTAPVVAGPDTTAPVLTFNPAVLTVASASTGTSTLTSTDNVGVTTGPSTSCTNGGSFAGSTFTAPTVTVNTTVVCTATASDAAGNSGTATLTATVTPPPPSSVIISGKVTFDHVPFNTTTNELNYAGTTQDPAPGLTVEAKNGVCNSTTASVLETTTTDANGDYSLTLNPNTNVAICVKAEMLQTSGARWNVRVIDNTNSDGLYVLSSSRATSGIVNTTRNLNAASGWGGSSYTGTRAAAPFAILAPIYESIQRVVAVDSDVVLPPAIFNWSVNNRGAFDQNRSFEQNIDDGTIQTSSYIGNGRLLILGDASTDTDEYDEHVVIHEWGHYFEDQLSRSDSIGGEHGPGDRLDPRVALGEGFGNALSGMMTDDPFYRDSGLNFAINVEQNNGSREGWFSEGSVQSILYDIYDADDDGADTISAGFAPIYNVLTSTSYKENAYFTTIFNFLEEYRTNNASDVAAVNALAAGQTISGTDAAGTGETNTGSVAGVLPLYKAVSVNGGATNACLNTTAGTENKLGNIAYFVFNVTNPGNHTLRMTRRSGATSTDPDFQVYRGSTTISNMFANTGTNNSELRTLNLTTSGQHIVDAINFSGSDACFDFTITR